MPNNNPIVFGSPEAEAVLEQVKQMRLTVVPDDAALAAIAERIWSMIELTYADNVCEDSGGTIVIESNWRYDMIHGIVGILKGWRP
jgi:hypothetical protein